MTRKRKLWIAAGSVAGLVVILCVTAIIVLRSAWFHEKVRHWVVDTAETATGGRVEIGSYTFDWRRLRVELKAVALHGTEPAGKPPLLRAGSIAIGLKIISILKRSVDIQYLDVAQPEVYLIVHDDGSTNIPHPKTPRTNGPDTVETILNLAIGRFTLQNGVFEVEAGEKTPFDVRGQNLNANFSFDKSGPRYRGELSIQPLNAQLPGLRPFAAGINLALTFEKNRIGIASANLTTGESAVALSGDVQDFTAPRASFRFDAHGSMADVSRIFRVKLLERGKAQVTGDATWSGAAGYSVTGKVHGYDLEYRDNSIRLQNFRAEGILAANPQSVEMKGLQLSGTAAFSGNNRLPVDGRIVSVTLRGKDLDARGVALAALGGSFHGDLRLRELDLFNIKGEFAGLEAKRMVAMYRATPLPWDGLVSGAITLEGSLKRTQDRRITLNASIAPARQGPPVHGQIVATYDAGRGILDLGRSTVSLPSSRIDLSGAIGRQLTIHLETRDLNDLLPALGESAKTLPLKLENGAVIFDGTVSGKLDHPQIVGHVNATNVSYSGESVDALAADVTASPDRIQVQNASVTRGNLRAQFQASADLHDWKTNPNSSVAGSGSIANANLADLATAVKAKTLPATGTLNATAQLMGTFGNPLVNVDLTVVKGTLKGEPFDRLSARVNYSSRTLEVASGDLTAGTKEVKLSATFDHAPGAFDAGRVRFQVSSNVMRLDQIQTVQNQRPGVKGTVQITANGTVNVTPAVKGRAGYLIEDLHANVAALGLQMTGQPLGDAHLTANSQSGVLRTHLDSNFANSTIGGDGEWRLEGDYLGSATITFSKLDFVKLREWLSPSTSGGGAQLAGSAEGQLRIDGSALKPETFKAELRIPKLTISPAAGGPIALTNSGPIVATLANSTITVESARLTGKSTDLSITGKVQLQQKNALDLRVNGHIDLAIMHELNSDFVASGVVTADATVRGATSNPQVNGRVQFQNAAFNIADLPNGISNANGAIVFTGDRATIESFSGETGGGRVDLSGFLAYGGNPAVFQLYAKAHEVRVRYPEGVSTVADVDLNLTGTADRSMLAGTITILRTGFNPQSDFSSLIASSAQPVQTPAARTGLLAGMNFDVQIATSPDIQVQSSLTEDVQLNAKLHLRGTASNPALLGRIDITQGQVIFFGAKYTINDGSIAFYNPVRVDPILNIDLETKARGIDVTLNVSGPLNKLNMTPRSDPPLQYPEIVALLATGRAPTSDPTLLAKQNSAPQSWQQAGASALLGQAIANPVAGRLQRFFGVSKLRIDPSIAGVANSPQARVTIEQQVTQNITFTYITNVTTTNPQVIQVEWAVSKTWSAVALREENGEFGLDFFFKKRFF